MSKIINLIIGIGTTFLFGFISKTINEPPTFFEQLMLMCLIMHILNTQDKIDELKQR